MPLQATSGAASYDAFGGGVPIIPNYIEEVFSTWLYTGNGGTQTITNGVDLSGKGGMVWCKIRNISDAHALFDTARGFPNWLVSNTTGAQNAFGTPDSTDMVATSTGFSMNNISSASNTWNSSGNTFASWTFRKQPKFFDIQTFTTASNRSAFFNHSLGAVPGCVIIKSITSTTAWYVYHRSLGGNSFRLELNSANGRADSGTPWLYLTDTSIEITSTAGLLPQNQTYVAYIFAHDSGGFGPSGTDNVISCGSFTTDGSGRAAVNLGYEPQWIMVKRSSGAGDWVMVDTMRGLVAPSGSGKVLWANLSNAENDQGQFYINSTGFTADVGLASNTYIYIAIRRGPMKVPTDGTKVFLPIASSASTGTTLTTGFPVDMQIEGYRAGTESGNWTVVDRLRSVSSTTTEAGRGLVTSDTAAENTYGNLQRNWSNTGFQFPSYWGGLSSIFYSFRRAPGFFDVVCYTQTSTSGNQVVAHNLTVAPEFVIIKSRNEGYAWNVWPVALNNRLILNQTTAASTFGPISGVTSTSFLEPMYQLGTPIGTTYVAYLFASCPGVSKVGSYTGTGTTQTINCGFTAGARFVLIKKTSGTGSWYVWDSSRGIVAGNDPYLLLNSTAAEVTNTDYVDTASVGFEISSTAPSEINENGGSFIFLAIA